MNDHSLNYSTTSMRGVLGWEPKGIPSLGSATEEYLKEFLDIDPYDVANHGIALPEMQHDDLFRPHRV